MKACPLCGRKYVEADQVVLPPTTEQVLSERRARRRADREAAAAVAAAQTVIPSARTTDENDGAAVDLTDKGTTWTRTVEVAPKLLSVAAVATFVSAFALGEGVALGFLS